MSTTGPESTVVRVALWRALHVEMDAPPHVITDTIGLQLIAPPANWRERPDMHALGTRPFRASILARARFVEDLVAQEVARGLSQYVIIGAGLDTFAQRRPEIASRLTLYEVDQPAPQAWKRQRLAELGHGVPDWLRLVPVNFEAPDVKQGDSWWQKITAAGFDATKPAIVASLGVSMYLTRDAIRAMLRQVATLAPASVFAMTFLLPFELADPALRPILDMAAKGAQASGTPFISYLTPPEMLAMAREAGFKAVRHISAADFGDLYFAGRPDGMRPPVNTEEMLVATVE